jgi:hypothetical protein
MSRLAGTVAPGASGLPATIALRAAEGTLP